MVRMLRVANSYAATLRWNLTVSNLWRLARTAFFRPTFSEDLADG